MYSLWLNPSPSTGWCRWPCSAPWRRVSGGCWTCWSPRAPGPEERLDELNNPQNRGERGLATTKKAPVFEEMMAKASPRLAAPLQPKTAEEAGKLKIEAGDAGFRGENAVSLFLSFKFAVAADRNA